MFPDERDKLRSRLDGRTELVESVVEVGNETYRIFHPAAADALIDEAEFDCDERLPYWAELWPSALALARYLSGRSLSGQRVIELGCGVGLPTVVALNRGAEVLATDHYEAALDFASYNARTNTGRPPRTMLLDWHAPPAQSFCDFDLVVAADVLYERRNVTSLVGLIPGFLTRGGEVLLADPRRENTPEFLDAMRERGFSVATENVAVEQSGRAVRVSLHRLRR